MDKKAVGLGIGALLLLLGGYVISKTRKASGDDGDGEGVEGSIAIRELDYSLSDGILTGSFKVHSNSYSGQFLPMITMGNTMPISDAKSYLSESVVAAARGQGTMGDVPDLAWEAYQDWVDVCKGHISNHYIGAATELGWFFNDPTVMGKGVYNAPGGLARGWTENKNARFWYLGVIGVGAMIPFNGSLFIPLPELTWVEAAAGQSINGLYATNFVSQGAHPWDGLWYVLADNWNRSNMVAGTLNQGIIEPSYTISSGSDYVIEFSFPVNSDWINQSQTPLDIGLCIITPTTENVKLAVGYIPLTMPTWSLSAFTKKSIV
jgi:hypothetical protein